MRIQVQWTTTPIGDWQWHDSADWDILPFKPEPVGGEILDAVPGWIYALNVQGVIFNGDHYAIEQNPEFIKVSVWNDDPGDFTPDQYYGSVWTFYPITNQNGKPNTYQKLYRYGGVDYNTNEFTTGGIVEKADWSQFISPDVAIGHGIWIPDIQVPAYNIHTPAFWQEWISE